MNMCLGLRRLFCHILVQNWMGYLLTLNQPSPSAVVSKLARLLGAYEGVVCVVLCLRRLSNWIAVAFMCLCVVIFATLGRLANRRRKLQPGVQRLVS